MLSGKKEESVKIMAPEMPFYRYEIVKKLKRTVMRSSGFSTLLKLNVKINGVFLSDLRRYSNLSSAKKVILGFWRG